uniref:Centrosomal protein of 162 kDa n=1 Tax=Erpetoichthys calabaricus TaxID=27687 RepID=A0A8C4RHA8_ERPCA
MEEIIRKRHPNSLPALIYAAASATSREVEGADKPNSVAFLERRIKKLEADLEGKDEDAKKSLRAMEQQFQKMKVSAFLVKANNLGANSENKESNYQPKTSGIEKKYLPDSKEDILQAENNVHNQHLTNQQMTTCHRAVKNLQKAEGHAINDFNSIDIERLQQELAMKNTKIQELAKTVEVLQKERRTLLSNQTKVEKIWEKKTKPSKADRINTESSSTQYLENPEPFPATLDEKCYQPNVFAGLHISDVLQENEKLKLEIEQLILETEKQKVTLQAALVLLPYSTGMNLLLEDTETYAAEHISCLKVAHQKELERIITQHALEHSSSKVAELTNKVSTQEKLALGTWNVTSLKGKEPELVREVERFRLDIVGLTSTHSLDSGTNLLERGWTFYHSGVAPGERRRAGVGILIAPDLEPVHWGLPRWTRG